MFNIITCPSQYSEARVIKSINTGKEKVKLSLYTDVMTAYNIGNSKEYTEEREEEKGTNESMKEQRKETY